VPAASTPTPTLTPGATPEEQKITDVLLYPNPFDPAGAQDIYIMFTAARKDSDTVRLKIYTAAFRLIREVVFAQADAQGIMNSGRIQCPRYRLGRLANGSYYYLIILEKNGKQTRSNGNNLIILK
jgi:hypothetical protein